MKPRKRLLGRIWAQAYKDCFRLGHTRVLVTQKELNALLVAYICDAIPAINDASNTLGISEAAREAQGISEAAREAAREAQGINGTPGIRKAIREAQGVLEIADAEAHMHELAVVPKDPHQLLSMDNAVVVTKERRRELLEELCKGVCAPRKET